MKRTLQVLAGFGLAGAVLLGGAASASAGTGHHHKHHSDCQVAKKCRPAPLPKPEGGWPCAKDHSCATKHHRPVCPPKPPVTPPKHHRPPVKAHPVPPVMHTPKPVTPQRVTAASPTLPKTGGTSLPLAFAGGAFVLGGAGLKRLARVR